MSERAHLSIGEVLSLLRDEFPDITISKIRFLESQGLLDPERTPSGYRKFYDEDVERLRWILRQQREHFLPLKVIKGRLSEADPEPAAGAGDGEDSAQPAGPGEAAEGLAGPADVNAGLWPAELAGAAPSASSSADTARPPSVAAAAGSTRAAGPARVSRAPGSEPSAGQGPDAPGADQPARRHPSAAATLFGDRPEGPPSAPSAPASPSVGIGPVVGTASGAHGAGETPRSAPGGPRSEPGPSTAAGRRAPSGAGPGDPSSEVSGPAAAPAPVTAAGAPLPQGRTTAPSSPGSRPAAARGSPAVSDAASVVSPGPLVAATPGSPSTSGGARGATWTVRPTLAETAVEVNLTAEELAASCGLPVDRVKELERFGLLVSRDVGGTAYYGEEAQAVAVLAAGFAGHGVEARHLRMYKNSAERESGLFEQIVMPLIKQRNPQARLQAAAAIEELSRLGGELRDALLRRSLRDAL